jgi:hypothetical protein
MQNTNVYIVILLKQYKHNERVDQAVRSSISYKKPPDSNLGPRTAYTGWGLLSLPSIPPGKYQHRTLKSMTAFSHTLFNLLFINNPFIPRNTIWHNKKVVKNRKEMNKQINILALYSYMAVTWFVAPCSLATV